MTSGLTVNKFIIYLVLITFTAGCTTMRPLPSPSAHGALWSQFTSLAASGTHPAGKGPR